MSNTTKPFLLLQSRPEDEASDDEFRAFCRLGKIDEARIFRVRMDRGELPNVNLDDYCGVLMGGGPANFAYNDDQKSAMQRAFEPWLFDLVKRIIDQDKPFLGACLGMGVITHAMGGRMSFDYPEPVGVTEIELMTEAASDSLMADMPAKFDAFVGHKEGVNTPPNGVTVLARSKVCLQMVRVGQNVYATQFHPELDSDGLIVRINTYRHAGYFPPEEAEQLVALAKSSDIIEPVKILERFVRRYVG